MRIYSLKITLSGELQSERTVCAAFLRSWDVVSRGLRHNLQRFQPPLGTQEAVSEWPSSLMPICPSWFDFP